MASAQGVTTSDVHFRWSHTHGDLEVISKDIMPIYYYAPSSFLGNQALSYGQSLSFSLRLDRGVRHPSVSDVVLQGAGLRVAASLGDLRTVVPCGKKITYSFRLDEMPGSKWKPELSSLQFQTLLSNLTAIMIRGTFGENGRGYLDNVNLVSAQKGPGAPAGWVEKCSCPRGYEGEFCERCAPGYKKHFSDNGPLSSCEPCACQAGSCDPQTGECYSSDDVSPSQSCPAGFYNNPQRPTSCLACPCPGGSSCSLIPGTQRVKCERCPTGTTGSVCQDCAEGFYGDPGSGKPCQRCQCNGHVDLRRAGSCDRTTGECLRCLNNTSGPSCGSCLPGFYHSNPKDACKECDCDPEGSFAQDCSSSGQCDCRPGFEGRQCRQSSCPSCFDPLKSKIDNYAVKVREIQVLFSAFENGGMPVNDAQMEKAILAAEGVVADMQKKAQKWSETEKNLVERLNEVSRTHMSEDREMQSLASTVDNIRLQEQQYQKQVSAIQQLIDSMKQKLQQAKQDLRRAELPSSDAAAGSDSMSGLAQKATNLAEQHQGKADYIEKTANSALSDAEKALNLMQTAMTGERKVKEQIVSLKALYDRRSSEVKALENEASGLTSAAKEESTSAAAMLKQISSLTLPQPPTDMNKVVGSLTNLKQWMEGNLTAYQALQKDVDADQSEAQSLLEQAKAAQREYEQLMWRVDAAKVMADLALGTINNNMDDVDEALVKLQGFDDKISKNKALADDAISKLPAIKATIQDAVDTNAKTTSVLDSVDKPYNGALVTVSLLEDIVTRLEQGVPNLVGMSTDLERDAGVLRGDVSDLQEQGENTLTMVKEEKATAETQRNTVQQFAGDAATALGNAQNTRAAVGETLKTVTDLLNAFGTTDGSVDLSKVDDLQAAVDAAKTRVTQDLKPRLKALEELEVRQKTILSNMSADIDTILEDIKNLQEIHDAIPPGCFNMPPIERP